MTLELWNTVASTGTVVVITATAIAALIQMRHARASNQIAALAELGKAHDSPEFTAAYLFASTGLATKLKDPEFRYQVFEPKARTSENQTLMAQLALIGNHFETLGTLAMTGLIDRKVALMLWDGPALAAWDLLGPFLAIERRRVADLWLHFEYFVVMAQDWREKHPDGVYPPKLRHIVVDDPWLVDDRRYAESRRA